MTNEIAADNATGYRVIGYAVAFKGSGRIRATNITESLNPKPWRLSGGVEFDPGPSERTVTADGTISTGDNEKDPTRNTYVGINGGWAGHRTPHMAGKLPAGGNRLMLDGHSEWTAFKKMKIRTDGSPNFWW